MTFTTIADEALRASTSSAAATARGYAEQMFRRQHEMLAPQGFSVDWDDQPSRHKVYPGRTRMALPEPFVSLAEVPVGRIAAGLADLAVPTRPPTLTEISDVLAGNCLTGRATTVNWNDDSINRFASTLLSWSRPTASGGGMYPVESYLVCAGTEGEMPRGVFHYDTARHALVILSHADRTRELEHACGVRADAYLVAAVRVWKNAFKYNSFSHHVITQDTGALLATWRLILGAHGYGARPCLWFDQERAAAVVGIDGHDEFPVVVLPLHRRVPSAEGEQTAVPPRPLPRRDLPVWERSQRTRRFPLVDEVSAAGFITATPRPQERAPEVNTQQIAADPWRPLPPLAPDDALPLRDSLLRRKSSFGLFDSRTPLSAGEVGSVLAAMAQTPAAGSDLAGPGHQEVRLWLLAERVSGIPAGWHAYDPHAHALGQVGPGDLRALQPHYALHNYNTGHAAAMIAVSGPLDDALSTFGAPGYRFLSVAVGQAAQAGYLAASAHGVGIGAVLGVDNVTVNAQLALGPTGEQTMLFLFLGACRPAPALYDHRIPRRGHRDKEMTP